MNLLGTVGSACLLAPLAHSGDELLSIPGNPGEGFGASLDGLGDIDGDGLPDLIVGGARDLSNAIPGLVRVHSSRDGAVLYEYTSSETFPALGTEVADAGDVDGDGTGDFWLAEPGLFGGPFGAGRIEARSGANGSLVREIVSPSGIATFGQQVTSPGDLDGDGVPEVVVSTPEDFTGGTVRAFAGADGSPLWIAGSAQAERFGHALDAVGDANLDGVPDLVATSIGGSPFTPSAPYAALLSGADGQRLFEHAQPQTGLFGASAAGVGDWDEDGRPDYAVGSGEDGPASRAFIDIHSGADGSRHQRIVDSAPNDFGHDLESLGDVSGDGVDDFGTIVLAPDGAVLARVLVGRTGLVHEEVELTTTSADSLYGLARLGDANADGVGDWAFSASGEELPDTTLGPGLVVLRRGDGPALTATPGSISVAAGGTVAFDLDAGPLHANRSYLLLGSVSGTSPGVAVGSIEIPLNPDDYFTNTLTAPNTLPLGSSLGVLGTLGKGNASFVLPPGLGQGLAGLTVSHAYVLLTDPLTHVSNAADFDLVP